MVLDLGSSILSVLQSFGYLALFGIVFAESGLFFGFFLPGDSLLFAAGLLASQGVLNLSLVLLGVAFFAVLGDQVGYWMGQRFGRGFFSKPNSFWLTPKRLEQAETFYQTHGAKAIVLARFVPVVRTFAPIAAGMARMSYQTFVLFNVLGGMLWTLVFVLAGFWLGTFLPNAGDWISIIILLIVVLSLFPVARELWREWKKEHEKKAF